MDFSSLIPVLVQNGGPIIGDLFTAAATATLGPIGGFAVKGVSAFVLSEIAKRLGVDPTPETVQAAIVADPAAAAPVIAQVQSDHADLIASAMRQAELDEQNVENARKTQNELAGMGSALANGPAVMGASNVLLFFVMVAFIGISQWMGHPVSNDPFLLSVAGFIMGNYSATSNFFLGTSQSARVRTDQALNLAHNAMPGVAGALLPKPKGRG